MIRSRVEKQKNLVLLFDKCEPNGIAIGVIDTSARSRHKTTDS